MSSRSEVRSFRQQRRVALGMRWRGIEPQSLAAFAQFLAIDQKDEADNLKAMETGARHRRREGLRRQGGGSSSATRR
jgi:hypothetical protein